MPPASPTAAAECYHVTEHWPVFDKRTGPMRRHRDRTISPSDAKTLLVSVNYEADVTWNENTYFDKKNNLGNLLVNVFMLCAII